MGITPQQFKVIQERLDGRGRRSAAPVFERPASPPNSQQTVLGLDPSLRGTGFGVIRMAKPFPQTLTHGAIACPANWERSRCLVKIAQTLRDLLKQFRPEVCVVEGLFYAQNLQTALIMSVLSQRLAQLTQTVTLDPDVILAVDIDPVEMA